MEGPLTTGKVLNNQEYHALYILQGYAMSQLVPDPIVPAAPSFGDPPIAMHMVAWKSPVAFLEEVKKWRTLGISASSVNLGQLILTLLPIILQLLGTIQQTIPAPAPAAK